MERHAAIDKLAAMVIEKESRATEVARLLHDNAGQTLSALGFHLQALGGDPEATNEIRGYLEQVMENVRLACNRLQSNVVERSGLPIALELLGTRLRKDAGLEVHLQVESQQRLPAPVGHAVYRIMELALDNVVKHSGVNQAVITLHFEKAGMVASVKDNGRGFLISSLSTHTHGTGLILMNGYASAFKLHLQIDSSPGQGTIIVIQTF